MMKSRGAAQIMSSRLPKDEDEPEEKPRETHPQGSSTDSETEPPEDEPDAAEAETEVQRSRIIILGERDIPFEEERPPNLLPNFQVKVHRIGKPEKPREVGT
jgi:hypothetical protein